MTTAADVVAHLQDLFPGREARPTPADIEAALRPLPHRILALRREIHLLLHGGPLSYPVDHWLEANLVVSGEGPAADEARDFLLRDTCTCVLDHLPAAITHAAGPVDPRISALLAHPYLQPATRD
jgi:hypothetical protein